MATNLLEVLTEQDKFLFTKYMNLYGIPESSFIGVYEYLQCWANSKTKLYHLLGNKLMVEIPYVLEKRDDEMRKLWKNMVEQTKLLVSYNNFYKQHIRNNEDMCALGLYLTAPSIYLEDKFPISYKTTLPNGKILQIQKGMKPLKVFKKLVDAFPDCFNKDDFEEFRLKHSLWLNERKLTGSLVISIHPLDFITMSDNDSGWRSCMNWMNQGCYRIGTVEMMNSNNVVCTYFKSNSHPFVFDKENNLQWNNKKWRQLFYITKDIITSGKSYPYQNTDLTSTILNKIRELAQENLHWGYNFGPEAYMDMFPVHSLSDINTLRSYKNGNKIIFDTKGMYNDMLNDNFPYMCVRNKVKKTKIISISGKTVCACCGDYDFLDLDYSFYDNTYIDDDDTDGSIYNERYGYTGNIICPICKETHKCPTCGAFATENNLITLKDSLGEKHQCCPECINRYFFKCPCCGDKVFRDDFDLAYYCDDENLRKGKWRFPIVRLKDSEFKLDVVNISNYLSDSFYYKTKKSYSHGNILDNYKCFVPLFMCHKCINKYCSNENTLFDNITVKNRNPQHTWLPDEVDGFFTKKEYTVKEMAKDKFISKCLWHNIVANIKEE